MYEGKINILCTQPRSSYESIKNVECWPQYKDAYNYNGTGPVITHAPCGQWSRLRKFSTYNPGQKGLAEFCLKKVNDNGGIFEHPAGSLIWKIGDFSQGKIVSINQSWWSYYCTKRTYLYYVNCKPIEAPITFNCTVRQFSNLSKRQRNETVLPLAEWLVRCIRETYQVRTVISK